MTPQSELEIKGTFFAHPFAELLVEIAQGRVDGSLRLTDQEKKCVVYFKGGRVVFAVSNARSTRLFDTLLRREKLKKEDLVQIPNFENDFELASFLQEKSLLTKEDCDRLFAEQTEGILVDILSWPKGEWIFSSLARVREGLEFEIDVTRMLVDFSRCMPVDTVLGRFRSLDEGFSRSGISETSYDLKMEEVFVLSRADYGELSAAGIVSVAAIPESTALHTIYTLWLGGLLVRNDWQPAFSKAAVAAMKGARLGIRTEAKLRGASAPEPEEKPPVPAPEAALTEPDVAITLEEYLIRVEKSVTHYDILGVDIKADADELKRAYFYLAKNFHPDRYHSEGGARLKRIQSAFTVLAQAHETLKSVESREVYDYRMRKEIADREKRAAGNVGEQDLKVEQASENFERGFNLLMDNEVDAALPFLARAVHFNPQNARYHAYYGKALSSDKNQRHKAESELQAALKLDANNPTFRLLLAEFFIQHNLLKRAGGELTRLLAVFPSNREARDMLERLKK